MKTLFEFLPVLLFFIAYKIWDIYVATAVIIGATALMVAVEYIRYRKVEKMHLIALILLVVLGGATIFMRDDRFIMWKVTVVNWVFAIVFIGSQYFGDRPLAQRLMEKAIEAPPTIWKRVNLAWAGFFVLIGVLNLWVATHFSQNAWVNFKMFGVLGLTLVFVIGQALVLNSYLIRPEAESDASSDNDSQK